MALLTDDILVNRRHCILSAVSPELFLCRWKILLSWHSNCRTAEKMKGRFEVTLGERIRLARKSVGMTQT
ncbi:MAG: hypothetical protein U0M08_03355, partial [Clostridia bacterium]|nr:hypothetical protein [Clostridia bacterium]